MSKITNKTTTKFLKSTSIGALSALMLIPNIAVAQSDSDEIIVTATRRAQTIQDVPYSISAVSGADLEEANVADLADLTRLVPGVAFADLGARSSSINNQLILRGLNASASGGVNAFLANNTPAGVSTYLNDTPLFTNLKLTDLERVEVLRGPQGTLYGANSIGGTLRFIFNKPDTEKFETTINVGVSVPEHSSEVGYNIDGVVNFPLSDKAALRIAGGYEEIAGFVDATGLAVGGIDGVGLSGAGNPFVDTVAVAPQEDIDGADVYFVRASLLVNLADNVEANLLYHRQVDDAEGFSAQTPGGTKRAHDQVFNAPFNRETDLYALEIEADLGFATLESSTSFSKNSADTTPGTGISGLVRNLDINAGGILGGYPTFNPGLVAYFTEDLNEETFAQEFRLVSNNEGPLNWIAGAYYQEIERTRLENIILPGFENFATTPGNPFFSIPGLPLNGFGIPVPPTFSFVDIGVPDFATFLGGPPVFAPASSISNELFVSLDELIKTDDTAIFGEVTYDFSDRFQMTFGARVFWNDVATNLDFSQPLSGALASLPLGNPSGAGTVSASSDVQSEIFKANASYDFNENLTGYLTWSEGFRRGGGNATPTVGVLGEDASLVVFQPDTVTNYEAGLKGTLGDRVNFTAAVYYMDWTDPQIPTNSSGGLPVVINSGQARTQGIELEANFDITENLSFTGGYGYVDAEFTEDFASALTPVSRRSTIVAQEGNKLPGVPAHSASWAFDYEKPVSLLGSSYFNARLDGSHRSSVVTAVSPLLPQYTELDGYSILNASIGLSKDNWRVSTFIKNITDEEGVAAVLREFGNAGPNENLDFLSRPRTYGVRLGYTFD